MGRQDGPGSESGGNVGYGGGGSFGGGMDEGQSSVTADTYSGGGSSDGGRDRGGSGVGRQDSPFSESGGNVGYRATNRATGPGADQYNSQQNLLDAIKRDIATGVNVRGRGYQTNLADRILGGRFGSPQNFGITSPTIGDRALSALGYDRNKSLMANVKAAAIPGQKTPLGALSLVPTIMGANPQLRAAISIGNFLAGQQMSKDQKPEQEKSIMEKTFGGTGVGRQDSTLDFTPSAPPTAPSLPQSTQNALDAVQGMIDLGPYDQRDTGFTSSSNTAATPAGQFLQSYVPSQLPQGTQVAGNIFGALTGQIQQLTPSLAKRGNVYTSNPVGTSRNRASSGFDTTTFDEALENAKNSAAALKQGISSLNPFN